MARKKRPAGSKPCGTSACSSGTGSPPGSQQGSYTKIQTLPRDHHPQDVRIVFRHYPLAIHDSAGAAARAAECAALEGDFEPFHHFLFANAKLIGQKDWLWFAREAGMTNIAAFGTCLKTQRDFPEIERDRAAGERLGVDGTPTFLVNDLKIPGFLELPECEGHVRDAIERARHSHSQRFARP